MSTIGTINFIHFSSILSSTKFFDANSRDLKLTSMFVFLKPTRRPPNGPNEISEHLEWRDQFELPANCRITVFNIVNNNRTNDNNNCCKNLNVFNDGENNGEKCGTRNSLNDVSVEQSTINRNEIPSMHGFYECKISIKGFKDQIIKGKSIWTQWTDHDK